MPKHNNERRRFLMQGATAFTALAIGGGAGCKLQRQQKVAKATAAYQPSPNGPQSCGNCANFMPPATAGWCRVRLLPTAGHAIGRRGSPNGPRSRVLR